MKRNLLVGVLMVCTPFLSFTQNNHSITGKISDAASAAVIPNCSVFINNTSKGTLSGNTGLFELNNVPAGTHELICSSIGYETVVYSFTDKDLPLRLDIRLKLKVTSLDAVTVAPFLKDGWKEWGHFFIENFIGTNENASQCTIKNTKSVKFRLSKSRNKLTAISDEPLIIENKALGYKISYQLENFSYDFEDRTIIYFGYPLFTEMETKRRKLKLRWKENRKLAYLGSTTHFMKCLYYNTISTQGFELRPVIVRENLEKKRVKALYQVPLADTFAVVGTSLKKQNTETRISKDSIPYYERILGQPDRYEIAGAAIPADSIVSIDHELQKILFFQGKISVRYTYMKDSPPHQSMLRLMTPSPIQIEANGNYFPPQELFTFGYWGYSEKLCNLLPLDESYEASSGENKP